MQVGPVAHVKAVRSKNPIMLRLMEMGLVPGAPVRVLKRAPFGGPMEIRVGDYRLSIRRSEARHLDVDDAGSV